MTWALVFSLLALFPGGSFAASLQWVGASGGSWFSAANWSPAQVPTSADDIVVDANATVLVGVGSSAAFNSLTLGAPSGNTSPTLKMSGVFLNAGLVSINPKATFLQDTNVQLSLGQIVVAPGGKIAHTANAGSRAYVVNLNVAGDFNLQAGASISVSGLGYSGGVPCTSLTMGSGPGGGGTGGPGSSSIGSLGGGGGGHIGLGGNGLNAVNGGAAYDDFINPANLGSGGGGGRAQGCNDGAGGFGGGAVLLVVGGALTLDGMLAADGFPGHQAAGFNGDSGGGGGAGGSVSIVAGSLTGTGTVHANGGAGASSAGVGGGGGSGGIVKILVTGNNTSSLAVQANSGSGVSSSAAGGAGVVAIKNGAAANYDLVLGGLTNTAQAVTPLHGPALTFGAVTLNNSSIKFDPGSVVNADSLIIIGTGTLSAASVSWGGSAEIKPAAVFQLAADSTQGGLLVDGGGLFRQVNTGSLSFASVSVQPGGAMTHAVNSTTRSAVLNMNVTGDFTLPAGASIALDGIGYSGASQGGMAGKGPGGGTAGGNYSGSGGGHGGVGGRGDGSAVDGVAYDGITNPSDLGSGGGGSSSAGGGAGGGAVLLRVGGLFTFNGLISANGEKGVDNNYNGTGGGGGSGGTVNVTAANLAGSGTVRANGAGGGASYGGSGGGGGRIAIVSTGSDNSTLTVQANSGVSIASSRGGLNGGAGTVALLRPGGAHYSLTIGNSTISPQANTSIAGASLTFASMTINNATVIFDAGSAASIDSMVAAGSATMRIANITAGSFVVAGTMTLTAGAMTFGAAPLEIRTGGSLALAAASLSNCNLIVRNRGVFNQANALPLDFSSVMVDPGGILTHAPNGASRAAMLSMNVSGDFILQAGATITVDGMGYAGASQGSMAGKGPGGGTAGGNYSGSGGGHGGVGGRGDGSAVDGVAYDDITNPSDLGSGGGGSLNAGGGAGGGAVLLRVGGMFTFNGLISANGAKGVDNNYNGTGGGGGSGGTVNVTAANLGGYGTARANGAGGGASYGGSGGGGGRVAIVSTGSDNSTLSAQANSGVSVTYPSNRGLTGGAGTVAILRPGGAGYSLAIGNSTISPQANTPIAGASPSFPVLTVNNATVIFDAGSAASIDSLIAAGSATMRIANITAGSFVVAGTMTLTAGSLTLGASPLEIRGGGTLVLAAGSLSNCSLIVRNGGVFNQANALPLDFSSIMVDPGGKLTHAPNAANRSAVLNLNVSGDFTLSAGAAIQADGLGYSGRIGRQTGAGPGGGGTGGNKSGGGGGHGGLGGAGADGSPAGAVYDSAFYPFDLGSQGGGSSTGGGIGGGAGGGAVILQVGGTFGFNGLVSANGVAGQPESYYGTGGGGGGGGTINITAANISGSGTLRANAGNGTGYGGAGGGGGRIALSYGAKTGSLVSSVAGGTGTGSGVVGTILDNGQLSGFSNPASTPTAAISQLQENLSSNQTLSETLAAQTLNFSGGTSTGVSPGTFSQAQVQLVTLQSGSFAGNGFFRGAWTLGFASGDFLSGVWQGAAFMDFSRRMVLKGVIEGGIRGVLEGALTESVPGSGVFDRMSVACRAVQVGNQFGSSGLYFTASAPAPQTAQYPGTTLDLLQSSLTGQTSGYSTGALENTFTLLTVNSSGNPYNGEGFFLPTYSSTLGTGVGWAYAKTSYSRIARLSGLYDQPLRSLFEGVLVTNAPRSLLLYLERLDVGQAIAPSLNVATSRPGIATPGMLDSYTVTIRNDGYAAATGVTVVAALPEWADFVSASGSYVVYNMAFWRSTKLYAPMPFVRWDLAQIPPRSTVKLNYQSRFRLIAPGGPQAHENIAGGDVQLVTKAWADQIFANYPVGGTP